MTKAEAQILASRIAAAFPREWAFAGEATNAIYVERIARLPYFDAARDAVDVLIDTETRLPTIAKIRDEYARYHDRYTPRALEEPPVSPEVRAANLERLRELRERISRVVTPDGQD